MAAYNNKVGYPLYAKHTTGGLRYVYSRLENLPISTFQNGNGMEVQKNGNGAHVSMLIHVLAIEPLCLRLRCVPTTEHITIAATLAENR